MFRQIVAERGYRGLSFRFIQPVVAFVSRNTAHILTVVGFGFSVFERARARARIGITRENLANHWVDMSWSFYKSVKSLTLGSIS